MAGVNQLLPFANGETPNVIPYDEWNALAARLSGFQSGIASSKQFNYILAQGGAAGYVIGQMVADYTTETATIAATPLYQAFKKAMLAFVEASPVTATGTTEPRNISDRFADVVNVKDFGAVGDGVTDDTAAIQAALNSSVGKVTWFPGGSYVVSSVNVPNGVCSIDFNHSRIIKSSTESVCVRFDNCENLTICNVHFRDLNGNNRAGFLRGEGLNNFKLVNTEIYNSTKDDQVTGCWAVTLSGENIQINGITIDQKGYGLWGDGIHFGRVKNLVLDNFVIQAGDDAIAFYQQPSAGTGTYVDLPSENIVVGNGILFSSEANCIKIGCSEVQTGNGHVVRNVLFHNIICASGNKNLINCTDARDVSSLESYYDDIVFSNVTFVDDCLDNSAGAIRFDIPLERLRFENCKFKRTTAIGYLFSASFNQLQLSISNCYVNDVSGSSNNLFQITGKRVEIVDSVFNANSTSILVNLAGTTEIYVKGNSFSGSETGFALLGLGTLSEDSDIYIAENAFKSCVRAISHETFSGTANRFVVLNNDFETTNSFTDISANVHKVFTADNAEFPEKVTIKGKNPRIELSQTSGSGAAWRIYSGAGNLYFCNVVSSLNVLALGLDKTLYPCTDNSQNLGNASYRWSQVYAGSGSINTSDSRCKASVAVASDTLLDAIGAIPIHTFQFTDAVEKKGSDAARFHAGVIAQEVASAFQSKGLDATRYGLFCHDTWQDEYETVEVVDQPEVLDENGEVVSPAVTHTEQKLITAAGDRYGIRYEELLMLECARLRRELQRVNTALIAHGITLGDE